MNDIPFIKLSSFLKDFSSMIHLRKTHNKNTIQWSFIVVLYICSTVASLNIPPSPYSVITAEEVKDHTLPEVSRRGYAGEDFLSKVSKSIPRMGRRSNLDPLGFNCKSCSSISSTEESNELNNDLVKEETNEILKIKLKRLHSLPTEVSAWPWFRDHIPDVSKKNEVIDNCYFMTKTKNYISSDEICYDDLICCPISTDATILKRYISTYSPKQTTTISPDYKANRFM